MTEKEDEYMDLSQEDYASLLPDELDDDPWNTNDENDVQPSSSYALASASLEDLLVRFPQQHYSNVIQVRGLKQQDTPQIQETMMIRCPSKDERVEQIKRGRSSEVHNISERRRRDKITGKIKQLQELMPHCKKKDRASILEEAANYVKSLQLQIDTLIKVREGEFLAGLMQCVGTPSMVGQSVPIRPGITFGSGLCTTCSAPYTRWINLLVGTHPLITPALFPGFPFSLMCQSPTLVQPTASSLSVETQPCSQT